MITPPPLSCYGEITQKLTNVPNSNPKPDLHNINAHIKFGENSWYLLKLLSGNILNENIDLSQAGNCQKLMKFAC